MICSSMSYISITSEKSQLPNTQQQDKFYQYVTRFAKKGLIHAVSRHTFQCHLLATSMHQQHMCLILLKVELSAFTQAFVSSLSGVHECSSGLYMAPYFLGKQTANCESPHK